MSIWLYWSSVPNHMHTELLWYGIGILNTTSVDFDADLAGGRCALAGGMRCKTSESEKTMDD